MRREEDRIACQRSNYSAFTIVLSTYGKFCPGGENHALIKQVSVLASAGLPIDRIIVSWNPDDKGVSDGAAEVLKYIHTAQDLPVEVVVHRENLLHNRFAFGAYLCTESVLHLDNDVMISPKVLLPAFELHRRFFMDRILGFYCATFAESSDGMEYISWDYRSPPPSSACDFVLTGLAFLARSYHFRYFDELFKDLRDGVVAREFSGEDLLMNFVIAYSLKPMSSIGLEQSYAQYRRVGAAVYFDHRKCFRKRSVRIDYGHNARYRKNLFQSPTVTRRKRRKVIQVLLERFGHIVGVDAPYSSVCIRKCDQIVSFGRIDAVRPQAVSRWYERRIRDTGTLHIVLDNDKAGEKRLGKALEEIFQLERSDILVWLLFEGGSKRSEFVNAACPKDTIFAQYRRHGRRLILFCFDKTNGEWISKVLDWMRFNESKADFYFFPTSLQSCNRAQCTIDSSSIEKWRVKNCFLQRRTSEGDCSKVASLITPGATGESNVS